MKKQKSNSLTKFMKTNFFQSAINFNGAMTLSITTLSKTPFSIMTLSKMPFSIMTLSILALSKITFRIINDIQHNNTQQL